MSPRLKLIDTLCPLSGRCVMGLMHSSLAESVCQLLVLLNLLTRFLFLPNNIRLDRLVESAKELSNATGQQCGYAAADVRNTVLLREAVAKCIAQFGKIDFVICGACVQNHIS